MEPSAKTYEEVGILCAAWSYLEAVTEHTLWGVLEADEKWGHLVSERLELQSFWKLILEHAKDKLSDKDLEELRSINKGITKVTLDRNIIVHGRIHAKMALPWKGKKYETIGPTGAPYVFAMVPCWTIFKGPNAGKSFPISTPAVVEIRTRVGKLTVRIQEFNKRFGHFKGREPSDQVETDWPWPPLE